MGSDGARGRANELGTIRAFGRGERGTHLRISGGVVGRAVSVPNVGWMHALAPSASSLDAVPA